MARVKKSKSTRTSSRKLIVHNHAGSGRRRIVAFVTSDDLAEGSREEIDRALKHQK